MLCFDKRYVPFDNNGTRKVSTTITNSHPTKPQIDKPNRPAQT